MIKLTGLKRAREAWPDFMQVVDDWREDPEEYAEGRSFNYTLRSEANGYASWFQPTPEWFVNLPFRHGNPVAVQYEREQTLGLVAFHNIRVVVQRFILNLKLLLARRRSNHGLHSASILGAW